MTAYDDIKSKLIDIMSTVFVSDSFDLDLIEHVDLVDDWGMDSIVFISIIVEVETHFEIMIPDDLLEMNNFKSIDNIVKIIEDEMLKLEGAEVSSIV